MHLRPLRAYVADAFEVSPATMPELCRTKVERVQEDRPSKVRQCGVGASEAYDEGSSMTGWEHLELTFTMVAAWCTLWHVLKMRFK